MHDIAQKEKVGMKSTLKIVIKAALAVFALFLIVAGIRVLQIVKMVSAKPPMPVETVTSAVVKEEDWAPVLSSVGSVSAVQGAIVSAELGGTVSEVGFESGAVAKKGDVLLRLDTSSEQAQLRSAEADLELARADLERSRGLAARKVISKAELDGAESKFKQKEGSVDNMRAMIAKKEVRAPFDGQLGIRQVNVGQMINAGQLVVPLQALDPVYVDFALPSARAHGRVVGARVRWKINGDQPERGSDHAQCAVASDSGKSRPRAAAGDVCQGRRCAARETQGARYSRVGNLIRTLRRFGFRDRKEKGPEERQRITNDPAAICSRGRSARRFRFDHERIESGRNGGGHGGFQIAQRHGRYDQQRSRAQTAVESDASGLVMQDRHEIVH